MTPSLPPALTGLSVEVARYLTGRNLAARQGRRLIVSRELFDAMKAAKDSEELTAVLAGVKVMELPSVESMSNYVLPMTTVAPNPFADALPSFENFKSRLLRDVAARFAVPPAAFVGTRETVGDVRDRVTEEEIARAGQRAAGSGDNQS